MSLFTVVRDKAVIATLQGELPREHDRLVFGGDRYIVYQIHRVYDNAFVEDHEMVGVPKQVEAVVFVNHEMTLPNPRMR